LAVLISSAPQIVLFAIDFYENHIDETEDFRYARG
jgi:hypothetical protein